MKITNKNVIRSVSDNQHQILQWIIDLYIPNKRFDYDPTYSKGVFYKKGIKHPRIRSCLTNEDYLHFIADAKNIPLKNECINSICFDPPFVMGSGPSVKNPKDGSNLINRRFGIFHNDKELWDFYKKSLYELYRVLKNNGVLVFKCQDCVFNSKQILSHVAIINYAVNIGFYAKDVFVLTKKSAILSGKVKKQQHARKFHSYFLVFIKEKPKVIYT